MKHFIKNIGLFAVVVLVITAGLDYFISYRLYNNSNRLYRSWNQVYQDTTHYDVIINGNSRAWGMYDPVALDTVLGCDAFNLGMDGSCINRQIVKYNKYVSLHGYPKLLIQNVDFMSLEQTVGYEREQFFPYFVFDRGLMRDMDQYEHWSWAEKYVPCYRYLGYYDAILEAFLHTNQKKWFEYLHKGYYGRNDTWDGSALNDIGTFYCPYSKTTMREFEIFLSEQLKHDVRVVFVYAPFYVNTWKKLENADTIYHYYSNVSAQCNIPILDYTKLDICTDTSFFTNATHLNRMGAEVFSQKLAHDIDSLQLISF